MAWQYNKGLIEEPTWRLVLILAWSNLYVLKSIPPTQARISPVRGSITIKAVCIICRWYLMESSGVMVVSVDLRAFQAKTFMGTFLVKVFRISASVISSAFRFLQRSLFFIAASSTFFPCSVFQTLPFLML